MKRLLGINKECGGAAGGDKQSGERRKKASDSTFIIQP